MDTEMGADAICTSERGDETAAGGAGRGADASLEQSRE
jgi:hypothetical protein